MCHGRAGPACRHGQIQIRQAGLLGTATVHVPPGHARPRHTQGSNLPRHDRIATGDLQAWRAAVEGLLVLGRFGEHLRGVAEVGHGQIGELGPGSAVGDRFDHHGGRFARARTARCRGVAQLQAVQGQPRLHGLRRLRLHLQRALGTDSIHAAIATAAEEVIEEAPRTAAGEARARQTQRTAALGNQQEATFDHVVATPVDLAHVAAILPHPLQRSATGGVEHQFT
ncbi:hypothetical protein D3C73_884700 [compost metagenome]